MKVFQVITKSNWGGAQRHVFDLATLLHSHNIDVTVLCGQQTKDAPLVTKLTEKNVPVRTLSSLGRDINLFKDVATFFELLSILRKERPDVLHLHSSKIGGLGSLVGRIAGIQKIIFTAHGTPFKEDRNWFVLLLIKSLSYSTVFLAHTTICVSRAVYDAYPKALLSRRAVTIYNGLSTEPLISKEASREELSISPQKYVVGTIAELHPNKGLPYLISACEILSKKGINFRLDIIGSGQDFSELQNSIKTLHLGDVCFLHGFVQDAAKYLPAFDLFVMSSINEGLPYVLLEAGAAGLPVVATSVGGVPEVIIKNTTGLLVPSKDPSALATAMEDLIKDESLRTVLAKNLHERVATTFSLEIMYTEIYKLYAK